MIDEEFDHWCRQQQLTAQTLDLIAAIRAAPPSRRVQGRAKNVSGVYPSRKMGQTIQFESHTVELWAIYQMEHDPEVLEFYDQPPPFKIQYQNQNGRKIGHYHTPDFFVLRTTGAAWEEWKTETELKRLAQKYPSRYQKTETGHWHCPPGEAYAATRGIPLMDNFLTDNQNGEIQSKLTQFKEYAVLHPQLARVDMLLMRAIREPAGFAHVLVYGPSGVGKTTMIRQIAKRLNENVPEQLPDVSNSLSYRNGSQPPMPLLLLETRPPDGGVFNRADYYRTALKLLGEPFYERRMLIDIDAEQTWEKKGRGRTKTAQFNDSPELRHALEEAMTKRGVRAVILDEAQHLMKIGTGASAGKLLDQLDWIKSMTNVTGVLHILIGTYELLNFRNLSGQASRRGLDIHFPRYLYQNELDRQDFQAALLALLMQVPMNVDVKELMQHWLYFYERSIGCVGVLKDWLIRAVAAALHDGHDTLSLERLHEHTLSLAQCERMALDTTEGEQKLSYMESRREHLWHLLQIGMGSTSVPKAAVDLSVGAATATASPPKSDKPPQEAKRTRKKPAKESDDETASTTLSEISIEPAPKKKQTRKKRKQADSSISEAPLETNLTPPPTDAQKTDETLPQQQTPKKSSGRVGQRKPLRDTVGQQ